VEFALVVPVVIVVILAVAEITTVARLQLELGQAAREAARVAATVPDPAQAVDAARMALGADLADRTSVAVERPSVVGRPAVVELTLPHRVAVLGLVVPLRASAVMRVER